MPDTRRDTRAGTIELPVPKLRSDAYFPDWLLDLRRRGEAALISVVATNYLPGVSTRRMDKLVETLGSRACPRARLPDSHRARRAVAALRSRPLGTGPYTSVCADALTLKSARAVGWSTCTS